MKSSDKVSQTYNPLAMAFFHPNGLVPSRTQASLFAGQEGRVATLPDIIGARTQTEERDFSWRSYFTTNTAEYFGRSPAGNLLIIVAHGVGPLADLDGVVQAYSWSFKDKERIREGARIQQTEFRRGLEGKWGQVEVLDWAEYIRAKSQRYPFDRPMNLDEASRDLLLKARLGREWETYLLRHQEHSRKIRKKLQEKGEGRLIKMGGSDLLKYQPSLLEDCMASASLLAMGGVVETTVLGESFGREVFTDVGYHGWNDGTRFCGIGKEWEPAMGIDSGVGNLFSNKEVRSILWQPTGSMAHENWGFWNLMEIGDSWFTQYPKVGISMDSMEPEFQVESLEEKGDQVWIFLKSSPSYFFKYNLAEIKQHAPLGANAYRIVDLSHNYERTNVCVQFFQVTVNCSKRLPRENTIMNDFDLLMKIHSIKNGGYQPSCSYTP